MQQKPGGKQINGNDIVIPQVTKSKSEFWYPREWPWAPVLKVLVQKGLVCGRSDGWMAELGFYIPFISISVNLRRWKVEDERLCAMKRSLGSGRIPPPAGLEPATPWSEVMSANRSATRMLQTAWAEWFRCCMTSHHFVSHCCFLVSLNPLSTFRLR